MTKPRHGSTLAPAEHHLYTYILTTYVKHYSILYNLLLYSL